MNEEKKFAVLIDADNVSAKYIKYILDELSNYGVATYKRIYGDWTEVNKSGWKDILLENAISPIQQYGYTTRKNSTDSAMIIDAMDILYTRTVDGFCIVSSDSDFTKLAMRLRESGMIVIGMGEEKTPKPFSAACNIFKYLDILVEEDEEQLDENSSSKDNHLNIKSPIKKNKNMTDRKVIEKAVIKIIIENGQDGNYINIGELGSRIINRYPDFDVRNYGYTKLSKFLESFESLVLEGSGRTVTAHYKESDLNVNTILSSIISLIEESPNKSIGLGKLSQVLHEEFNNFNIKNYGYSKFSNFIKSFSQLKINKLDNSVSLSE